MIVQFACVTMRQEMLIMRLFAACTSFNVALRYILNKYKKSFIYMFLILEIVIRGKGKLLDDSNPYQLP